MKFAISTKNEVLKFGEVRSSSSLKSLFATQVDTDLSKAYQKANPYGVLRSPDEAADKMLATLAQVELKPVGRFIDIWDEKDIPW